ncbi:MAG: L,D-transpeptidase [Hyphomicrobiales bacterium]|nr:L,D-transpeptidase [Hyphomicrobiales bacterium]
MKFLKSVLALFACLFALSLTVASANAEVSVRIDLSAQRMQVANDKGETFNWAISSGRAGFHTPRGEFRPYSLQRMHYSRKYHMSPMPHSIFFKGGYAIHGTGSVRQLGQPASHGCIRLAPGNAAKLFAMVQKEGARIAITGSPNQNVAARSGKSSLKVAQAKRLKQQARALAARQNAANPMAYAPTQRTRDLRTWQAAPVERVYPGAY